MLDVSLRLSPRRKIQYDRQTDRLKAQPSSFRRFCSFGMGSQAIFLWVWISEKAASALEPVSHPSSYRYSSDL